MVHFSECSTVAANCKTETQIEMRDGTVERFPVVVLEVLRPAKDLPAARVRAVEGPVPHVGPDVAEHLVLAADGLPPVLTSAPEAGVVLVRLGCYSVVSLDFMVQASPLTARSVSNFLG